MIHDERWTERLGRSAAAAVIAGMLASLFGFVLGFVLSVATDHDPAWIVNAVVTSLGVILVVIVFAGTLLGLAMAVPLHFAMMWLRPRSPGRVFLAGAAGVIAAGLGAMTLDSEALSGPLLLAALLVATALGGIFFYAMLERWTWTEPCAS